MSLHSTFGDVYELGANALTTDEFDVLSQYSPKMQTIYSKLINLNTYDDILALIPIDQDMDNALPRNSYDAILEYLTNIVPYVNLPVEFNENIVDISAVYMEAKKMIANTHDTMGPPLQILRDGFPPMSNNKIRNLTHAFNLPESRVYTAVHDYTHSKYLEEYMINLYRSYDIDPIDESIAYSQLVRAIHKVLNGISQNNTLNDLTEPFVEMLSILRNQQYPDELYTRVKQLAKMLAAPNFDETLTKEYPELIPKTCRKKFMYNFKYIQQHILEPISNNKHSFPIDVNQLHTIRAFLSAYPFHKWRMYTISHDSTMVNSIGIHDDTRTVQTTSKYAKLKSYFDLSRSYEDILSYCTALNFSGMECQWLLPVVFDFRGYVCNFLATLVTNSRVPLFGLSTRRMYMLMKNLNVSDLAGATEEMCRYENNGENVRLIDILPVKLPKIAVHNYEHLVETINWIETMAESLEILYILCAQYTYSDVLIYKYCTERKPLSVLRELILCRLLLNLNCLSTFERDSYVYLVRYLERIVVFVGTFTTKSFPDFGAFNVAHTLSIIPRPTLMRLFEQGVDIKCHYDAIVSNLNMFPDEFLGALAESQN